MEIIRKCFICKKYLLISNFNHNRTKKDVYATECTDCIIKFPSKGKVTCDGGKEINKDYLKKHILSKIHKKYIK